MNLVEVVFHPRQQAMQLLDFLLAKALGIDLTQCQTMLPCFIHQLLAFGGEMHAVDTAILHVPLAHDPALTLQIIDVTHQRRLLDFCLLRQFRLRHPVSAA